MDTLLQLWLAVAFEQEKRYLGETTENEPDSLNEWFLRRHTTCDRSGTADMEKQRRSLLGTLIFVR